MSARAAVLASVAHAAVAACRVFLILLKVSFLALRHAGPAARPIKPILVKPGTGRQDGLPTLMAGCRVRIVTAFTLAGRTAHYSVDPTNNDKSSIQRKPPQ